MQAPPKEPPNWDHLAPLLRRVVIAALEKELAVTVAADTRSDAEMTIMQAMMTELQEAVANSDSREALDMAAISGVLTHGMTGGMNYGREYVRLAFLSAINKLSE